MLNMVNMISYQRWCCFALPSSSVWRNTWLKFCFARTKWQLHGRILFLWDIAQSKSLSNGITVKTFCNVKCYIDELFFTFCISQRFSWYKYPRTSVTGELGNPFIADCPNSIMDCRILNVRKLSSRHITEHLCFYSAVRFGMI